MNTRSAHSIRPLSILEDFGGLMLTARQTALIARNRIVAFVFYGGIEYEVIFLGRPDTESVTAEAIGRGMRHIALIGWSPSGPLEIERFEDLTSTGEQALMAARSAFLGALAAEGISGLFPRIVTN